MRSRRAHAASTLAAAALATSATIVAGANVAGAAADDEGDKNTLLAEAQFQLWILTTSDFEPTDITCTRPSSRDDGADLLCYALISDRVSVAAVATMESPGVYTFVPLNKVDPADLADPVADTPAAPEQPASPDPAPAPAPPDASDPPAPATSPAAADQAILEGFEITVAEADDLSGVLTENNDAIVSVDALEFDVSTATFRIAVTTDAVGGDERDELAFYVTDVMAYPWMEGEPARDPVATIRPQMEVAVDGITYATPFDVMIDVADYNITGDEWLQLVTEGSDALKRSIKAQVKGTGKLPDSDQLLGVASA